MVKVSMLNRAQWCFTGPDGLEFFETCQATVESLMARGVKREWIMIDYEADRKSGGSRDLAQRYADKYGVDGAKFMPRGVLDSDEYPAKIRTHQSLRKSVLVCPHCKKPIREWQKKRVDELTAIHLESKA